MAAIKTKNTGKKGFFGQIMRFFWKLIIWFNIISLFFVVLYKFVPVPYTPLMVIRYFENKSAGKNIETKHHWVPLENISKNLFLETGKGRPYEIRFKGKTIKTILPKYSDIAISEKHPLKYYEGEKLAIFNEAGFLEIAIFRSNPHTFGSASSLLGIRYRDVISIIFK